MRVTQICFRQHLGWHFKKHWRTQGKKVLHETGAEKILAENGIPVYEPQDILGTRITKQKLDIIGSAPRPVLFDRTHPDWHDRVCLTHYDNNVLLEGLIQAKIITKTVETLHDLPEKYDISSTSKFDSRAKNIILNSHVLDSQQVKLPIVKDPERPAWVFPRTYGIEDSRVNTLLVTKLLQLIEVESDPDIVNKRGVFHNLKFSFPFEMEEDLIQFQLRADTLVSSEEPLSAIMNEDTSTIELPNIFPIKHTITLNIENIYKLQNTFPLKNTMKKKHPHTIFVHYNPTEVKNLYEEEVTEDQIIGRSLIKAFTVAASYARQEFGEDVKYLPKPVTVQCVQTDGRLFHFGVLQLNTLDLGNEGVKNVWYHKPRMPLFNQCAYVDGKPVLEGYNKDVVNQLSVFYNNS